MPPSDCLMVAVRWWAGPYLPAGILISMSGDAVTPHEMGFKRIR